MSKRLVRHRMLSVLPVLLCLLLWLAVGVGNRQSVTLTFTSVCAIASGSQAFTMSGSYQSQTGATLSFSSGLSLSVP